MISANMISTLYWHLEVSYFEDKRYVNLWPQAFVVSLINNSTLRSGYDRQLVVIQSHPKF
jgi:hypothetical protein